MSDFPFDIPTVQPSSGGASGPAPAFHAVQTGHIQVQAGVKMGYNSITMGSDDFDGTFYTIPQDGLYQFNFSSFGGRIYPATNADAQMLVDPVSGASDYVIGYYYETMNPSSGAVTGGFSMTSRLVKGDKVYMKTILGWAMFSFATGKSPCSFSGFYISP